MLVPRTCLPDLLLAMKQVSSSSDVLLVEGARQVGKTTVIRMALKELGQSYHEINLEEDLLLREEIKRTEDFNQFKLLLSAHLGLKDTDETWIFIDEAQECQQLGRYVRFLKEKWSKCKFILSGSSMKRLFPKDTRIPVGRIHKFLITPFNFREFLLATKKNALVELINKFRGDKEISAFEHKLLLTEYDNFLEVGGLPEVIKAFEGKLNYQRVRLSLLLAQRDDFIGKEKFEKSYLFEPALKGVANNLGYPSKNTQISDNNRDAKEIVSLLERWYLVYTIEQRSLNVTSNFHPKRYLYDLGTVQELRSIPFPKLSLLNTADKVSRSQLGGLIENSFVCNFISVFGILHNIQGWKKSSQGAEVDFIWRKDKKALPIEIKSSLKFSRRSLKGVELFLDASKQDIGFVVSAAPFKKLTLGKRQLYNLPVYLAEPLVIDSLVKSY